jgi:hypothetical protein
MTTPEIKIEYHSQTATPLQIKTDPNTHTHTPNKINNPPR